MKIARSQQVGVRRRPCDEPMLPTLPIYSYVILIIDNIKNIINEQ